MRYRFVQDAQVADALHVVTVRSQRASTVLAGVDVPELPAGVTVVRASDIPGSPSLEYGGRLMPVLARDAVAYVGEPIALVAARDLAVAQAVAGDVVPRYGEPLPAEEGADSPYVEAIARGDPVAALGRAPAALGAELATAPRRFAPPAPQVVVAAWDSQTLVVRAATQHPFHLRGAVAATADLPLSRVRVIAEPLDGPGGKLLMPSLVACHAALVALRAGRAARVRYSWREELGASFRIAGTRSAWQAAPAASGTAGAVRFRLDIEGGAWDLMADEVVARAAQALAGPYNWEAVGIDVAHHRGDTVPCELPPGCGELEAVFVRELAANALARAAGMDPAGWRAAHLLAEQPPPHHGEGARGRPGRQRSGAREVIDEAVRISDFLRRHAANEAVRERRRAPSSLPMRGTGIAFATFGAGFGPAVERATRLQVSVAKDRRVTVWTGIPDGGRGAYPLFAEVAATELGVPVSQVTVAQPDTAVSPPSGPAAASRTAAILVPLLRRCCATLKRRMERDPLPVSAESQWRPQRDPDGQVSSAATVAAVEVDEVGRLVRCTGLWIAVDAGEILDPERARRVVSAALVRGLGIALVEESDAAMVPVPPASVAVAATAPAYPVAGPADLCPITVSFLDRGRGRVHHEPRGLSELALLGVAPAVAAAVAQATGRPVLRLPFGRLLPSAGGAAA